MIRRTRKNDIKRILEIYESGSRYLKAQGVNQWQDEEMPGLEKLKLDIENNHSYIYEIDGEIVATAALCQGIDPTYIKIYQGNWNRDDEYIAIHRFAVAENFRNKGVSHKFLKEIEILAKEKGIDYLRIDTHKDNEPMKGFLKSNGFKYRGIIYLENGDLRLAFDKST